MDRPNQPHDAFIKALLDAPERASIILRENLPAAISAKLAPADPRPLPGSYIDPELGESQSDRLFEAELLDGRPAYIYVLIEHKSAPDPLTPLQLLGYQQRIWRRYIEHSQQGRAQRSRRLPPIIPLVLYNGRQEWDIPLSVLDCIDADDDLQQSQGRFGYHVRHLRPGESDEQLSSDPTVRAGLRALAWAVAESLDWQDLVRLWRDLPPRHALERELLRYISQVLETTEAALNRALETTRPQRAEELKMTVAQEWLARGKEQGLHQGRQEGEAAIFLNLLERKFGTEARQQWQQRVSRASSEQLEAWSMRLLNAETVEEVFQ